MKRSDEKPIFVIEDDQDIRDSIVEILRFEKYEVYAAENGREGLDLLDRFGHPCVILLDLFMPVMDGAGFLESLKIRSSETALNIPIIILSAAPPHGEIAQKVRPQVSAFIKKPADIELILGTVQKFCSC